MTFIQAYQEAVNNQLLISDPGQIEVVNYCDTLLLNLIKNNVKKKTWYKRLVSKSLVLKGLYLWGDVGRGKTHLMDMFYALIPFEEKLRVHFHHFMKSVHQQLSVLQQSDQKNPLSKIVKQFAQQYQIICLDEFFITDVADAMILAELLQGLFNSGVCLIITSNLEPDALYLDGVQRERFLPAIESIKKNTKVMSLQEATDYRTQKLIQFPRFLSPDSPAIEQQLSNLFKHLTHQAGKPKQLTLMKRPFNVKQYAPGVIWCDYDELCKTPRSALDYIELAQSFHTVIISHVPQFKDSMENQARRFIALIDEFYDCKVNVIMSAASDLESLYQGKAWRFEFARTRSRLLEMQSEEYLKRAHYS